MEASETAVVGSWIKKIWPVSRFELRKVLPLLLLKFFVSLVYATLTCMKDSLVVTAAHSGAEVIPVLKGGLVFPLSLLCAVIYSKLTNHYTRSALFYGIVTFFLVVIFAYGFILFPHAEALSPHETASWLMEKFGGQFSHWIAVYRNWVHSLFFVTAELWAQVVIFILYWGFANHICQVKEAKRTYTLFIAAGDIATIVAGPLVFHYISKFSSLDFTATLQILVSYVLVAGVAILFLFWWMNRYVLSDQRYYDPLVTQHGLNEKTKLTLGKSIRHIFSSKYLLCIAALVISCALTINIVEVTWKAHVKELFPHVGDYMAFVSKVTTIVGVVALVTVLLFGSHFLQRFGWHFSAQIAPVAIGSTGAIFFLLSYFKDSLGTVSSLMGTTPIALLVLLGAFQNVTSKVVKYSFFDSTKEMAYIPLDQESKVKGKAAIDMVGSRLGKSSSSWLQVALMHLAGTSSVLLVTPYLIPVVIGATLYWSYAVKYLSKQLTAKEREALAPKPHGPKGSLDGGVTSPPSAKAPPIPAYKGGTP